MDNHILIIEDSPTDAAILIAAFEGIGYLGTIQVAKTGVEALNMLRILSDQESPAWPDLILLDLNLPSQNGLDVLADIKGNSQWKVIPTVVLSSSSSSTDISGSYQRHANAYISKPRQLAHYETVAQTLHTFWIKTVQPPTL